MRRAGTRRRYLDRVTSPFGFESTAAEVIAGIGLHGRRALVTGAAGDIGTETARALASAGAETVIATPDDPTAAGTDAAGVAAYALDPEAAERLWTVSEQMNQ